MPINLDVSQNDIDVLGLAPGVKVALRDPRDEAALAIITSQLTSFPLSPVADV